MEDIIADFIVEIFTVVISIIISGILYIYRYIIGLNKKITTIEDKIDIIKMRLYGYENDKTDQGFIYEIDEKVEQIDNQIDRIDEKVEHIKNKVND